MNSNNGTDCEDIDALDKQQLVDSFAPKAPEEMPSVSDNQYDNSNKDHNGSIDLSNDEKLNATSTGKEESIEKDDEPIDNNEEEQALVSNIEVEKPDENIEVDSGSSVTMEEPVLIAGTSVDRYSDLFKFILRYFSTFDNNLYKIYTFYSKESKLSLAAHGDWRFQYWPKTRKNLTIKRRGAGEITELLMQFPYTKHIEQSIRVEIVQQSSEAIICNVFGVFVDLGRDYSPRKFSRNMTIVPAGDPQIVLQEHIQLMPDDAALFRKFKPIIDDYRYVMRSRPDLIEVSCEIAQWAKELSETHWLKFDDLIDLLTEIVRVHPQWKFSSQEARMAKWIKDETGMSVTESMELLNGLDIVDIDLDLLRFVKKFKKETGMSISFCIDFLAEHDSLGAALIALDTLRDDK